MRGLSSMSKFDFDDMLGYSALLFFTFGAWGPLGGPILAIIGRILDVSFLCWVGGIWFICGVIFLVIFLIIENSQSKAYEEEKKKKQQEQERQERERKKQEKEATARAWNIPQCKIDAPKGDPEAQYLLGRAFLESIGVQYDEAEGLYWLEQAAKQGHKEAYKYLHNMRKAERDRAATAAIQTQMIRDIHEEFEAKRRNEKLADDIARKIRKGY